MLIKFNRPLLLSFYSIILVIVLGQYAKAQDKEEVIDYNSVIGKADTYFAQGDYINAKLNYQYAERMKPDEEYPNQQLAITVAKLHEKMKLLDQYTAIIAQADELANEQEYDKAIEKYKEAGKVLPGEGYPNDKIDQINSTINDAHHKKFAYDDAIYRAEKFLKYDKYEQAIEQYKKAHKLFPDNPLPNEKIEELEGQLEELVEARKSYGEVIENADRLFQLKYYEEARKAYVKAGSVKPKDDYTKSRIREIDEILVEKSDYDHKISLGDSLYMDKQLEASKAAYQEALSIYPAEKYPQDMIDKVNASLMKLKSKDELYSEAIAAADTFLVHKDYANALKEYENASSIRSSAKYPKEKINTITSIIKKQEQQEQGYALAIKRGDQYVAVKKWANAKQEYENARKLKPDELYAAEKLSQIEKAVEQEKAVLESYQASMNRADSLLVAGKLDEAETEYNNALLIIPGNETAKTQLKKLAQQRKLEEQNTSEYSRLIAEGDNYLNNEKFQDAIDAYTAAQKLDAKDTYASLQINIATQRLNQRNEANNAYNKAIASADIFFRNKEYDEAYEFYQQAAKLKPGSSYPTEKMAAIASVQDASKKSKDEGYQAAIKKADGLYQSKQYKEAKLSYLKASKIKPGEAYPISKMDEITKLIGDRQAIEASYNKFINLADRKMAQNDFEKDRMNYKQAATLKPDESYPASQLSKIDAALLKSELSVQEQYNQLITDADQSVENKDYEAALDSYQQALKLKPGEKYPSDKISEVELLKNDLQKKQDNYNRLIAEADREFTSKNLEASKKAYIEASALFPDQEHPKNRIDEIKLIYKQQNQEAQASYDKAIADADKLFAAGSLVAALNSYQEAQKIMPDESYPGEMITNIREAMNNLAARDLLSSKITVKKNDTEKLRFDPIDVSDRRSSTLLIRARGIGIRGFKVFVSYGKGNSKKGGFIMPVNPGEDYREFIFNIGEQNAWFSTDNNYISITPQGGSIEVEAVKILKGK